LPKTNFTNATVSEKFIDLVSKYRRCAHTELRGFLENKLPTISDDWWKKTVLDKLEFYSRPTMPQYKQDYYSSWKKMTAPDLGADGFDLACLLDIFDNCFGYNFGNWSQVHNLWGFKRNDKRLVQGLINGMRDIRERTSHEAKCSADDIHRDFDTIQRFLELLKANREIIDELQAIKDEVQKEKLGMLPAQEGDPPGSPELVGIIKEEVQKILEVVNKPPETDPRSSEELAGVKKELQKMQERFGEIANKPPETDPRSSEELAGVKKELQKMQKRFDEIANKPPEADSKSSEELAGVKKELQKMQKRFEEAVNRSQGPVSGEPPRKRKLLLSAAIVAGALSVAGALVFVFANRPDITWAATADSSANTTAINFGFDASVFRLISGNITIAPGSGSATMGELTGRRRARSLEVFVERAGTVHITIDRPGIETRTETVFVHPITWAAAADSSTDTSAINLNFGIPVSELTAGDITVTDGTAAITTGALTGGGSSWSLELAVANQGNISVSVARPGIEGRTETLYVHPITWVAAANSSTDTTAISFSFGVPVSDLTANDITIIEGTGSATAGALTGGGASWSLELAVANAGDIAVSVSVPGIEYRTGTLEVHPVTWAATAVGAPATTRIHFTFGAPVAGLSPGDITIADGIGLVQAALTGSGTSWSLPVSVTGSSYVSVSIARAGIEDREETLAVHPIAWSASADSSTDTTAIGFSFGVPVPGLTANDINIIDGTGSATAKALTGGGASWRLAVAVTNPGSVTVSVAMPGIEYRAETMEVHPITWTATTMGNPTTSIDFTFGVPVSDLSANDIDIPDGAGLLAAGALTGGGTSWSLPVTVTATGLSSVPASISVPGIERRTEELAVRPTAWIVRAEGTPATTGIGFIFDAPVPRFSASYVTITHETGFVAKGDLTGEGSSWLLPFTVTRPGYVSVSIARPGIEAATKTVAVNPITWHVAVTDIPTTTIDFVFDAPVSELTADDIVIVGMFSIVDNVLTFGGPDLVKGDLTGGGTSWSLAVDVLATTPGGVSVSIVRDGIYGGSETADIFPIAWSAGADSSTDTTAISFLFAAPVPELTRNDITVTDGSSELPTGALTGDGTWWWLEVAVAEAGNIYVSVDRPGVHAWTETIAVHPVTWSAATGTSGINFSFGAYVSGLTANDIVIEGGTGLVKGALTGGGTSWLLPVSVSRPRRMSVSISRPGIEERTETVSVLRNMVSVGANHRHTVAIRKDGSLWAWGWNRYGQLGNGTVALSNVPVPIVPAAPLVSQETRFD